jgi:hypothetical protein
VNANGSRGQGYSPGQLTPALESLFKEYGLSDEWKNYRLKGSQTDWIDATGRTTLLGNSVTEAGFVQTSSCITCHVIASFDSSGSYQPTVGFTTGNQSQNGPVNPGNFHTRSKPPYGKLKFLQNDFVWALFKASSVNK